MKINDNLLVILISFLIIITFFGFIAWLNTPIEIIYDPEAPPLEYSFGFGETQE